MEPMWAIAAMGVGIAWAIATRKMVIAWLERRRDPTLLESAIRLAELQVSVAVVQEQLAAVSRELGAVREVLAERERVAVPSAVHAAGGSGALTGEAAGGELRPAPVSSALPPRQAD